MGRVTGAIKSYGFQQEGRGIMQLRTLQLEVTSYCNAHCHSICPHHEMQNKGTMSEDLYYKILHNAAILQPPLKTFVPILTGEPLLVKDFSYRIAEARRILHNSTQIKMYTNGSFLNNDHLLDVLSILPKLEVWVSLNGDTQVTRQKIMGLDDYNEVVIAIDKLAKREIFHGVILVLEDFITDDQLEAFAERWQKNSKINRLPPYALRKLNFAGDIEVKDAQLGNRPPCLRAIGDMTVLWDGRVNLCCMRSKGEEIFGDLNDQLISEVWNSAERQRYAIEHLAGRRNEIFPCDQCNM